MSFVALGLFLQGRITLNEIKHEAMHGPILCTDGQYQLMRAIRIGSQIPCRLLGYIKGALFLWSHYPQVGKIKGGWVQDRSLGFCLFEYTEEFIGDLVTVEGLAFIRKRKSSTYLRSLDIRTRRSEAKHKSWIRRNNLK
ncbi:hypothetical protein BDV37DRAFT_187494 [Aspergillus pseudonomiae]|uniref:Uncharacterized protein n=1 Tax=Aspergillus pseudonomiae TaxID=1506151 RepID=A0A5N7D3Z4_9EURO|nr:uncharacterized protein BDV37DRAFT_187494 [Aspergillus pseudonomiae]KAE8401114.1 hypothetical protein BDV37DRAFT_187494 [Aspergillus pseudonomiae]